MSLDKEASAELARVVAEMREEARERRDEDHGAGILPDHVTADLLTEWADRLAALSSHGGGGEAVADACPYKAALALPWVIGETYTTLDVPRVRIPVSYRLEWIDRSESSLGVAAWRDLEKGTLHLQNLRNFQPPKADAPPPQPRAEGMVLVPREPTDKMKFAGAYIWPGVSPEGAAETYRAMLAAAPGEGGGE